MTIGRLFSEPNKLQWGIAWGKAPSWQRQQLHKDYWFIHIWFLRLKSIPPPGQMITKENYRGFRLYKQFDIA